MRRTLSILQRAARAKPNAAPDRKRVWFSPTGISTLERCPRCFWLQYHEGIRQPEGIVSRLANRFDEVMKRYFNAYRGTADLPPMIAAKVRGRLESPFQEKYFHTLNERFGLVGKLDECLVMPDGTFAPFDFKTTSKDPATKTGVHPAYQFQLDTYAFLLKEAGKPPSGAGYLLFLYPEDAAELHDGFPMRTVLEAVETDPERASARLAEAVKVYEGPLPSPAPDCPFCLWFDRVKPFFTEKKKTVLKATLKQPSMFPDDA